MSKKIAIYCGSNPGTDPKFMDNARELGRWIGEHGYTLVYGGSNIGVMDAVSSGALEVGGEVIGVEVQCFADAGVLKEGLTETHIKPTLNARKEYIMDICDAFVALPGGMGTLEEISEIFSHLRLGDKISECYLLNTDGFYDPLKDLIKNMETAGFTLPADTERVHFPETVELLGVYIQHQFDHPREPFATASEMAMGDAEKAQLEEPDEA